MRTQPAMRERFVPTTLQVWSGLLIWALNFLFVYVFAALACARGFSHVTVAGLPLVPVVTSAASLAAFVATLAVMRITLRQDSPPQSALIRFLALGLSALALLATLWVALPPLILHHRC